MFQYASTIRDEAAIPVIIETRILQKSASNALRLDSIFSNNKGILHSNTSFFSHFLFSLSIYYYLFVMILFNNQK